MMKKFLIFVFSFWLLSTINLSAYSLTGHDAFSSIDFLEEGKLLVDMTTSEIEDGYEHMGKRKFIGWKHHFFTVKKEATYIGEVIFAKSNRSSETIKLDYNYKETKYSERSVKVGGSLSGKFTGTIKNIDTSINTTVNSDYGNKDSFTREEETSFVAIIKPNCRVIFRITGDALVTNGVSKYFFFGITFNKGSWEYIDVITRYYELVEEEIS